MGIGHFITALLQGESGKGAIRFALGTCLVALAVAMSSPAFEANPLLNGMLHELRQQLPHTLDKAREAMGH